MTKNINWSEEELKLLKDNFENSNKNELIKLIPTRNLIQIQKQAYYLKLKKNKYLKFTHNWSIIEINIMKQHYETIQLNKLIKLLPNKPHSTIEKMAKKMGLRRILKGSSWSYKEINFLKLNYGKISMEKLQENLLNRNKDKIYSMASRLNLTKKTKNRNKRFSFKRFSKKIQKRDNFKCFLCSKDNCNLNSHHIDKNTSNNDVKNLITLCPSYHKKVHINKKFWEKLNKAIKKKVVWNV